jgi:hypothetical protein
VPAAKPFNGDSATCKPRRSARAGKRQAASFAKAHRQPPTPDQIDEVHERLSSYAERSVTWPVNSIGSVRRRPRYF